MRVISPVSEPEKNADSKMRPNRTANSMLKGISSTVGGVSSRRHSAGDEAVAKNKSKASSRLARALLTVFP